MNRIFQRLNIFVKPVWLREPGGLSSLLVSKIFDLGKKLITTASPGTTYRTVGSLLKTESTSSSIICVWFVTEQLSFK